MLLNYDYFTIYELEEYFFCRCNIGKSIMRIVESATE